MLLGRLGLVLLVLGSCQAGSDSAAAPPRPAAPAAAPAPAPPKAPERLKLEVLASVHHDPAAYTQGLVWHEGMLYESTGQYGASSLRRVNPQTGEVVRFLPLPERYFAEGLALVDGRLFQLTWKEETAFLWTASDFQPQGELQYSGEGWGLCWDGSRLVMSDGSDHLTFRDPKTFASLGGVDVTLEGQPLLEINELECVNGAVWANVWQTDQIVRIDSATGLVTAVVDAAGLLTPEERAKAEVLNGIAWKPETKTFLITGKYWPKQFEVTFVETPVQTP
jgi:glutamine cyclotransferase